jgi:hypothetical protein
MRIDPALKIVSIDVQTTEVNMGELRDGNEGIGCYCTGVYLDDEGAEVILFISPTTAMNS